MELGDSTRRTEELVVNRTGRYIDDSMWFGALFNLSVRSSTVVPKLRFSKSLIYLILHTGTASTVLLHMHDQKPYLNPPN